MVKLVHKTNTCSFLHLVFLFLPRCLDRKPKSSSKLRRESLSFLSFFLLPGAMAQQKGPVRNAKSRSSKQGTIDVLQLEQLLRRIGQPVRRRPSWILWETLKKMWKTLGFPRNIVYKRWIFHIYRLSMYFFFWCPE